MIKEGVKSAPLTPKKPNPRPMSAPSRIMRGYDGKEIDVPKLDLSESLEQTDHFMTGGQ
jgi:hypothetical protein